MDKDDTSAADRFRAGALYDLNKSPENLLESGGAEQETTNTCLSPLTIRW